MLKKACAAVQVDATGVFSVLQYFASQPVQPNANLMIRFWWSDEGQGDHFESIRPPLTIEHWVMVLLAAGEPMAPDECSIAIQQN